MSNRTGRTHQSINIRQVIHEAVDCQRQGKLKQAEELFQAILRIQPHNFDALHLLGALRGQMGNHESAVELISRALELQPNSAEAHANLGNALAHLGRFELAIASFDKALALRPGFLDLLEKRGVALAKLRRYDEAITDLAKAASSAPGSVGVFYNLAQSYQETNQLEAAIASYDELLKISPKHVRALNKRGIALAKLRRFDEALATFDKARVISPSDIDVLMNRGTTLQALNDDDEAISSYERVISLRADHANALNLLGILYGKRGDHEAAVKFISRALRCKPELAEAHANLGMALYRAGEYERALASFQRALQIKPDLDGVLGRIAIINSHLCNWSGQDEVNNRIVEEVRAGKAATTPFALLSISDSPADQLVCARRAAQEAQYAGCSRTHGERPRYCHDRIRVAYISSDYHDHATAYLTAGLFEQHDRTRFEIFGVSLGPEKKGEMRSRLKGGFEHFVDVGYKSDKLIAQLLTEAQIDIAVDLKGFTRDSRPGIFAWRPASIQVNYLGFPGTMAAEFMDYVIADNFVIPEDQRLHYTEKVVYLPESYQVNDSKRKIADQTPTRAELGLPEDGFVFACFNNSYKIAPKMYQVWMRLLERVPSSVLWMLGTHPATANNLKREAGASGVNPNRLVFAPRVSVEQHLARQRQADLFLDTLPYNAHTTASDALWAGLPVLTCAGTSFASRVAGSLLRSVGLPELITFSFEEYEALALKLAGEPNLLHGIKEKLVHNRLTKPLFDTNRFRRHIEVAFATMWEIHQRGEAPRSFSVSPLD